MCFVINHQNPLRGLDHFQFTKWPEVTPVVNITKKSAVAFLKSIVCRFGVPNRIIADNGIQFKSRLFQEYCGTSASSYALRP